MRQSEEGQSRLCAHVPVTQFAAPVFPDIDFHNVGESEAKWVNRGALTIQAETTSGEVTLRFEQVMQLRVTAWEVYEVLHDLTGSTDPIRSERWDTVLALEESKWIQESGDIATMRNHAFPEQINHFIVPLPDFVWDVAATTVEIINNDLAKQ
ncbi:hypothetical protein [Stratiformator vulcanicus]|uniref:Uncharacterized protein n=1 Tax=Stratiformator vulcanicus TaxID=2527980 RepID=A0A517QVX6_9PLAN|nr:hypothetical protein [Stratiformator vulcanicus]QDT35744.1 hypothetical protein Pan189_00970 [Stratiformator vulcanicus]